MQLRSEARLLALPLTRYDQVHCRRTRKLKLDKKRIFCCLQMALLLPAAACASTAPVWNPEWSTWLSALQNQYSLTLTQGSAYLLVNCDEYVAVFGTCNDNNPAAPYVMVQPPVTDGFVDPVYAVPFEQQITIVGGVPVPVTDTNPADCTSTTGCINIDEMYQLADTEALVVIMSMPPQAAYFGYQSYVKTKYVGSGGTSPDPTRDEIDGSVGNAENHQIIANQTGSSPFGTAAGEGPQFAFITTSNVALEQQLRSAFAAISANGLSTALLTEPLWPTDNAADPGLVPTGYGAPNADLHTIIRYTLPNPAYQAEAQAWRTGISSYVQVYKISAPAVSTATLFGPVGYTAKTGRNESTLKPALAELEGLLNGYLASVQGSATTMPLVVGEGVSPAGVPDAGLVGQLCIANDTSCLSDTQDTDAYRHAQIGALAAGNAFFVVGVNHSQTANAIYVSIAANDATVGEGVASISTVDSAATGFATGTLRGSAKAALQSFGLLSKAPAKLKAALPDLYVAMFTRNACQPAQTFCVQLGTASGTGIPSADEVSGVERAYLLPGATSGANPTQLLNGVVIF